MIKIPESHIFLGRRQSLPSRCSLTLPSPGHDIAEILDLARPDFHILDELPPNRPPDSSKKSNSYGFPGTRPSTRNRPSLPTLGIGRKEA